MNVTIETPAGKRYAITIDESAEGVSVTTVTTLESSGTPPTSVKSEVKSTVKKPEPTTLILRGNRLPGYQIAASDRVYEFRYKVGAERPVRIPFSYCTTDIPVENLKFLRRGPAHTPFTIVERDEYAGRLGENSSTSYPVNFCITEIDWE